jgi:hypothetical protein
MMAVSIIASTVLLSNRLCHYRAQSKGIALPSLTGANLYPKLRLIGGLFSVHKPKQAGPAQQCKAQLESYCRYKRMNTKQQGIYVCLLEVRASMGQILTRRQREQAVRLPAG